MVATIFSTAGRQRAGHRLAQQRRRRPAALGRARPSHRGSARRGADALAGRTWHRTRHDDALVRRGRAAAPRRPGARRPRGRPRRPYVRPQCQRRVRGHGRLASAAGRRRHARRAAARAVGRRDRQPRSTGRSPRWQDWSETFSWDGPWETDVRRSALALKLLLFSPTGAIAAAATTSLPERIGGSKNWDYRYTWVRDTAYTLDAFIRCEMREEVHAALAWLLSSIERNGPSLRPFYTLSGGLPSGSHRRDVPGYRHSVPVMQGQPRGRRSCSSGRTATCSRRSPCASGTATTSTSARRGCSPTSPTAAATTGSKPDAGMWELPDEQHFTLSKISCWQALDRAAQLAEKGQLAGNGKRWRHEAERVRAWVDEHCWSDVAQAYTFYAGTDELDAGVLLGARFGFDRAERMAVDDPGRARRAGQLARSSIATPGPTRRRARSSPARSGRSRRWRSPATSTGRDG